MQVAVKEEGSSSTSGKEDTEVGNATNEGQTVEIPTEEAEVLPSEPENQDPIVIKESGLERGLEEEVALK